MEGDGKRPGCLTCLTGTGKHRSLGYNIEDFNVEKKLLEFFLSGKVPKSARIEGMVKVLVARRPAITLRVMVLFLSLFPCWKSCIPLIF